MKKILTLICLLALSIGAVQAVPTTSEPAQPATEAKLEYNLGVDFYKVGKYELAMTAFRKAIELDPNYIDAYYNLGSILEFLKQDDAALTVFKQIIVRKPDDYEALYKAAKLSQKLGDTDNARSYLSLIPPSSPMYKKGQEVAALLQTDMQTIKMGVADKKVQEENKFYDNSSVYDNILSPTGITTDSNGNIYVAGFSDNSIYKITPTGQRVIFLKDSRLNGPIGMVSDNVGNIYIANYNNNNVLKVNPTGGVMVLIANIQKPYGLHIDGNMLFISSQGSNSIIRYKLN